MEIKIKHVSFTWNVGGWISRILCEESEWKSVDTSSISNKSDVVPRLRIVSEDVPSLLSVLLPRRTSSCDRLHCPEAIFSR